MRDAWIILAWSGVKYTVMFVSVIILKISFHVYMVEIKIYKCYNDCGNHRVKNNS
jgi:hypothetical protein